MYNKREISLEEALNDDSVTKFVCDRGFVFEQDKKNPDQLNFETEDGLIDYTLAEDIIHWGILYVNPVG